MNSILFVVSHLGSGSSLLCEALNSHPLIQIYRTDATYNYMDVGLSLVALPHKSTSPDAIWGEELLHNYRLSHRCFYRYAKFVYILRGSDSLHEMRPESSDEADADLRYYCLRLRRICEMVGNTLGAPVILYRDLDKPAIIERYLGVADLQRAFLPELARSRHVTLRHTREAQECFERHYRYLRGVTESSS